MNTGSYSQLDSQSIAASSAGLRNWEQDRELSNPYLLEHYPGLYVSGGARHTKWQIRAHQIVSYEVSLCDDLLLPSNPRLARAGSSDELEMLRRLVVVDAQVHELYGARIREYFTVQEVDYDVHVIDAHEAVKTMESVFRIVSSMDKFGITRRREPVIAIGGGVLTDLVGLAASLYRRSTPYVRVPTTLMGMIDAAIGVKTGANFFEHKNRLGSYYAPTATLIDPTFLSTLDARHLSNGLAEVLKIALVKDAKLFELLESHGSRLIAEQMQRRNSVDDGAVADEVIRRSIHGMLQELQPNLWEHELQRLVDYGHSFSPNIEMHALPELLHGEAVSIDMALSLALAQERGLLSTLDLERILAVMRGLNLPKWHRVCTPELLHKALAETVKHRNGQLLFPLTIGIGAACFVNDITAAEVERALEVIAQGEASSTVVAGKGRRNE
jgi:2-epi-5-epi-valiolone synthase